MLASVSGTWNRYPQRGIGGLASLVVRSRFGSVDGAFDDIGRGESDWNIDRSLGFARNVTDRREAVAPRLNGLGLNWPRVVGGIGWAERMAEATV
jgi:hypothetical protein